MGGVELGSDDRRVETVRSGCREAEEEDAAEEGVGGEQGSAGEFWMGSDELLDRAGPSSS